MQCSGCGTLLEEGQFTCPNCGRMVWSRGPGKQAAPKPKARASLLADPEDSSARIDTMDELELSDPAHAEPDGSSLTPDPRQVLDLLAEDPALLEPGLELVRDASSPSGVDYPTDVGSIDLLARDAGGALVVVIVAKGDSGSDLVADILQRIGWVRKHVAKTREGVRGVVVMDEAPANLSYAAAAVADTVAFRTYRLKLSFEKVEL
jgi:RecB family endonuclease NucS